MTIAYLWREHAATDGVTELRLHGVGGTTPESMLFDSRPIQVAGDQLAGFYRTDDCDGRHVEAYSWGGLTSRSATRALWLLLFPFLLANVAGWAQVHARGSGADEKDPREGPDGLLLQLLAVLLTVQVVAGVAVLAMDLVAYQCGGRSDCVEDRWWMSPFEWAGLPDHPGGRIVLGAVVPLALLGLLLFLGKRTAHRYEDKRPAVAGLEQGPLLLRTSTWERRQEIRQVRLAHMAAGLATVAGLLALATATLATDRGTSSVLAQIAAVGALVAVLSAAGSVVARGKAWQAAAALAAAALAAATLAALQLPRYAFAGPADPLRGIARVGEAIFAAQILLLIAAAAVAWRRRRNARQQDQEWPAAFRWCAPAVLSGLAVLLTGALFGGSMLRVADTLGTPADASVRAAEALRVPASYEWLSVLFLLTVVAAGMSAAVMVGLIWKGRLRTCKNDAEADYGTTNPDCTTAIAKARRLAGGIRDFDALVTWLVAGVLALTVASVAWRLDGLRVEAFEPFPEGLSFVRTAASWAATLLPVGAVALVANGYRSPDRRRTIGILWDLGTFWPRWFHPLAPPCYAERAIPDLQCRLQQLTGPGGRVIVSAHSQGTIWATVALNSLPAENLKRIAYLTYGSPLSYLYPTLFPDHFPAASRGLAAKLFPGVPETGGTGPRRWRNLWRKTDPIGGPVSDDGTRCLDDDQPLADPAGSLTTCGACRPVAGHSHYLEDQALVEYTEAVAERLRTDIPAPSP